MLKFVSLQLLLYFYKKGKNRPDNEKQNLEGQK